MKQRVYSLGCWAFVKLVYTQRKSEVANQLRVCLEIPLDLIQLPGTPVKLSVLLSAVTSLFIVQQGPVHHLFSWAARSRKLIGRRNRL